ncbi:unnamed protein product [Toxocara canis]|uniref:Kinesin motor domain-containing protein n=1 Tax=Toxocara canis TaxID=6265 RepID=A0A183U2U2_TOXCA|nr:unnamed protein product [Toxocara canis]
MRTASRVAVVLEDEIRAAFTMITDFRKPAPSFASILRHSHDISNSARCAILTFVSFEEMPSGASRILINRERAVHQNVIRIKCIQHHHVTEIS